MSEMAESKPVSSAYALVIGIGTYRHPGIRPLRFTHADAGAFSKLLLDPERAGFPEENVKVLLDEEATLFNVKHAISDWLYEEASGDSTVIVYFSGHGGLESDRTGEEADGIAKYLLPWDANPENLFASALSNNDFNRLLRTIRAKRRVIFMDACYAAGVTQAGAKDVGIIGNPYGRLTEGEGRVVIASAQPNQRSWEDERIGHGIFTYHLIEALQGKADVDDDGRVSILEAFKYLERMVPESARRLARSEQSPLLCGDISKDIILTANARKVAEVEARQSEAARLRREEIQKRRTKLFDLYNRGALPMEAYQEALTLIETPSEGGEAESETLNEALDTLLREGMSAKLYLRIRDTIPKRFSREGIPKSVAPPKVEPSPESVKENYCMACGSQIYPGNLFCIGCGRRV
ncbi:MAG: caspase family protein [Candidatus Manganitrophaceae bacterium]